MVEAAAATKGCRFSNTGTDALPCEATPVPEHLPEIAALRTTLDELQRRVVALIDAPGIPQESSLVAELYSVERLLIGAGRALARAEGFAAN